MTSPLHDIWPTDEVNIHSKKPFRAVNSKEPFKRVSLFMTDTTLMLMELMPWALGSHCFEMNGVSA